MIVNGYKIEPSANLYEANLIGANLYEANLIGANLIGANLIGANLIGANLYEANLIGANLIGANLSGADLGGANLSGANLSGAYLRGADLRGANLYEANLYWAYLYWANLSGALLPDYHALPDTGHVVVYKKVRGAVLTLFVPHDAPRTSCLQSRKCRVARAKVIASDAPGTEWANLAHGDAVMTRYVLGEWIEPDDYNDDIREECTHGIHVFATYEEAKTYS